MTDLLVIGSSLSDPGVHGFGASSPAAHDDDVERTPPREETKPKENRPSDPTMKAVLSCSPGNPRNQRKLKVRALGWGTKVKRAMAGEEIQASSKPGSPVSKPGSPVSMATLSPRRSPRGRKSKRSQQRKDVHGASNMQKAEEEACAEENKPLLGDESGKQASRATMAASPTRWQQLNEVQSGSNMQKAKEAYEEEDKTTDIDPLLPDEPGKETDNCLDVNLVMYEEEDKTTDIDPLLPDEPGKETDNCLDVNLVIDQSSSPGNLLEETGRWTGEKRAKVIASPPNSQAAHYKEIDDPSDKEEFWDVYDDPDQLNVVQERLALYRIKAHKQLWEGKELNIAQLKEEYSLDTLRDEGYFEQYELNQEWYFDPEYCKRSALDDYQRLVLHNDVTYISWESYHTTCSTLKCDQEFLQFYEDLWRQLKSIEVDDVEPDKKHFDVQRTRYEIKAHTEAPKIAASFSSIYSDLVETGIKDCVWSAMFDLSYHKDLDHVFFEIWKRVAKDKVGFKAALEDLYKLNLYPLQHRFIKAEVEERPLRSIKMKEAYYNHVAHIDENVPEDEVVALIKQAVNKILPKSLIYVDYIRKKLEVAKEIGVIQ